METITELFGAQLVHIIQGTNAMAHKILLGQRQETGPQDDDPELDFMTVADIYWALESQGANVDGVGLLQLLLFVDPRSVTSGAGSQAFRATASYVGGLENKYYVAGAVRSNGMLKLSLTSTGGVNLDDLLATVFLRDFRPTVRLDTVAGRLAVPPPLPEGVTPLRPRKEISRTESPHNANWADKSEAQLRQMCTELSAQLEMIATGKADLQREHEERGRILLTVNSENEELSAELLEARKDKATLQAALVEAQDHLRLLRSRGGSVRRALRQKLDDLLLKFG